MATTAVSKLYSPILLDELVDIYKSGLGLNVRQFVANRKETLLQAADEKDDTDGAGGETTSTTKAKNNNNPLLLLQEEDGDGDEPKIPTSLQSSVEVAVVTQTVRVLYSTLAILMEEEDDDEDDNQDDTTGTTVSKRKRNSNNSRGFG
jgi:hypothetical protein